jgi:hypothetical protein
MDKHAQESAIPRWLDGAAPDLNRCVAGFKPKMGQGEFLRPGTIPDYPLEQRLVIDQKAERCLVSERDQRESYRAESVLRG